YAATGLCPLPRSRGKIVVVWRSMAGYGRLTDAPFAAHTITGKVVVSMNTGGRGAHRRLSLITVIATLVVWSLASGPAAADLRVRTVESFMGEESTGDLLLKQSRVRVLLPDGSGQIFYCAADEFVVLTPPEDGRYWQGSIEEFQRSEEHTSELQSRENLVCRLLLEKKKIEL